MVCLRHGLIAVSAMCLVACNTAQGIKKDVAIGAEKTGEALQKSGEAVGGALKKGGDAVQKVVD
jgi:predicted small secreted protein